MLTKNTPPDGSILVDPDQFIQISNVKPIPVQPLFQQAIVPIPEKIARFYHVNDVTRFQHDRPVYKGQVDRDNEFKSLWIERTIIDIEQPLPGILRWFEITNRAFREVTPVEFACETMENVDKELWDLIVQYRADPSRNINPFSMRLQGIIDANVMGGISKYQEAFFSESFANSAEGRNQLSNVQRLRHLILEQAQILETALELHGSLAPEGVQPLHNRLLERFGQMKQNLGGIEKMRRQHSESIVNTPLPPLPIEKRAMSLNEPQRNRQSLEANGNDRNSNYYQLNYEQDTIYTRPAESFQRSISQRETNCNGDAPPIPLRPKSIGYNDSPEVPPKTGLKEARSISLTTSEIDSSAPPLPPRGYTPDKRNSNPLSHFSFSSASSVNDQNDLQAVARRAIPPKYSVVNISLDEQTEADSHSSLHHAQLAYASNIDVFGYEQPPSAPVDFRDSGISTTMSIRSTGIAECVNIPALKEQLDVVDSNANADILQDTVALPPPPIPKKTIGINQSFVDNERIADVSNDNDENDIAIDGYCVPKALAMATEKGEE